MIVAAGGPKAVTVPMNLEERGPFGALIAAVGASHPHLFAVINKAGVMYPEPIMKGTVERWRTMFEINVLAVLEGTQAAVRVMQAHGKPSHIINIGSIAARWEVPSVYGVTKRAVEGIGATLRQELEDEDIRITTIIPGGFATQLARGFLPEQLATVADNFRNRGVEFGSPESERLVGDPQHIADMVRYVLERPIDLNLQEIVIRPAVDTKT